MILATPSRDNKMLAGLTSRWITPSRYAAANPPPLVIACRAYERGGLVDDIREAHAFDNSSTRYGRFRLSSKIEHALPRLMGAAEPTYASALNFPGWSAPFQELVHDFAPRECQVDGTRDRWWQPPRAISSVSRHLPGCLPTLSILGWAAIDEANSSSRDLMVRPPGFGSPGGRLPAGRYGADRARCSKAAAISLARQTGDGAAKSHDE